MGQDGKGGDEEGRMEGERENEQLVFHGDASVDTELAFPFFWPHWAPFLRPSSSPWTGSHTLRSASLRFSSLLYLLTGARTSRIHAILIFIAICLSALCGSRLAGWPVEPDTRFAIFLKRGRSREDIGRLIESRDV
jgi:hypothetical protein